MDIETAFDLSSHEHRRAIVAILDETSPISRNRLTERVADRLDDSQSGQTRIHSARTTRCRIRIALHHNHLPRLAEAGVVEYDDERGVVRLADSPGVADCLDAAAGVDLQ